MRKISYHGYEEGYDMRVLRLGNLAFDFAYPQTKKPYHHHEIGAEDTEKWATSDQRPLCYMAAQGGKNFSIGLGLQDLLDFSSSGSGERSTVVIGKDGSKVEVIEPDKFFDEVVLANDEARFWLESRLAVARRLQMLKGYIGMTPKIWLLIGLYHIQDAVTFSIYGQSAEGGFSGASPLPEPTGLASLLQLKIGMKAKIGENAVVQRGAQISGKKVWAALWQRVDAKFVSVKKWEKGMGGRHLKLLDMYSWQTVRAGEGEQAVAEVVLADDVGEQVVQESNQGPGKDYWEEFDKEVAYIEDEWNDST